MKINKKLAYIFYNNLQKNILYIKIKIIIIIFFVYDIKSRKIIII